GNHRGGRWFYIVSVGLRFLYTCRENGKSQFLTYQRLAYLVARSVDSCHDEATAAVSRQKGSVRFPPKERVVDSCHDDARMASAMFGLPQNGHDGARVVVSMWPTRRLLSRTGSWLCRRGR
ncbi:unnamed protein product, partial [Ectocarpus sp. 12 AP-2014]